MTSLTESDLLVPTCIHWTTEDVANWIEEIGFPQYRDCFESNLINGRKLVLATASNLPRMGITDFEHILFLTSSVRKLFGLELQPWCRSIADPIDTPMATYLQKKSRTGPSIDNLTYSQFLKRGEY